MAKRLFFSAFFLLISTTAFSRTYQYTFGDSIFPDRMKFKEVKWISTSTYKSQMIFSLETYDGKTHQIVLEHPEREDQRFVLETLRDFAKSVDAENRDYSKVNSFLIRCPRKAKSRRSRVTYVVDRLNYYAKKAQLAPGNNCGISFSISSPNLD